jgi:hypothetical protein
VTTTDERYESWAITGLARIRTWVVWLAVALAAVLVIGVIAGHGLVEHGLEEDADRVLVRAGYTDLDVDFVGQDGTVTGTVPSADDEARIEELVGSIGGVRSVTVDVEVGATGS